jgi:hypothetical protein
MASSPGVTKQGFFTNLAVQKPTAAKTYKAALVDMGGNGDCFKALAAGIVDNFLSTNRIKNDFYNLLMVRHLAYFPQHRPTAVGLMTPSERMGQISKRANMAELMQTLAYTLRQIAVDEILANPAKYRAVFAANPAQTSSKTMRNSATWLDRTALAAAANVLGISIEVKIASTGQELPMRVKYNPTGSNSKVSMQQQGNYFIPYIANRSEFSTVKAKAVRVVEPNAGQVEQHNLTEIRALIDQDDARVMAEFQNMKRRLEIMLNAGEISQQDLLQIYIAGLHDTADARNYNLGTEHGTSALFAAVDRRRNGVNTVPMSVESHKQQIAAGLVDAIARNVSFGLMSSAEVFEQIDNIEHHSRHLAV